MRLRHVSIVLFLGIGLWLIPRTGMAVIEITLLDTYEAAFPDTTQRTVFSSGDTVYVRAFVYDSAGTGDITSATLLIVAPDTTEVVNTTLTPIFTSPLTNIYEYSYLSGTPYGQYDYTVTATGGEGTDRVDKSFFAYDTTRVKISSLAGRGYDRQAVILWETSMEMGNLGFNVYRSISRTRDYERINPVFIHGLGDNARGGKYLFIDNSVVNTITYYYRVEDVEKSGKTTLHGPLTVIPEKGGGIFQYRPEDYIRISSTDVNSVSEDSNDQHASDGGIKIISSDEAEMVIEITPPDYRIEEVQTDGGFYHEIHIDGYGLTGEEGYPRIPTRGFMLELSQEGDISLTVIQTKTSTNKVGELNFYTNKGGRYEEASALWEDSLMNDQSAYSILTTEERRLFKERKRARKNKRGVREKRGKINLYPQETLLLEKVFKNLGKPTILLRFYPMQVKKNKRKWTIQSVESIRARIEIKNKYHPKKKVPDALKNQFLLAAQGALKIRVKANGIMRLDCGRLRQAGFDMEKDPRKTVLFVEGKKVPVHIQGEKDGRWDSEDFLEFYGEGNRSEYSDTRVYWLSYQNKFGPRIPPVSARPGRRRAPLGFIDIVHREENHYYYASLPNGAGKDRWFWDYILGGEKKDFSFTAEHIGINSGRGWITVNIQALTHNEEVDKDHHTRIYLNDTLIGDFYWDGPYDYQFSGEVDHSLFVEGENILSVEEVGDTVEYDFIYLNSISAAYNREYIASEGRLFFNTSERGTLRLRGFNESNIVLYDITCPDRPRRLVGSVIEPWGDKYSLTFKTGKGLRCYAACGMQRIERPLPVKDTPSHLNSPPQGADYIIITHPDFLAAVRPLADYRSTGGMNVLVADVNEIYDEFSFGNFNPSAIRDFLSHAWRFWPKPSPENVLLVGGGTFDFKDYLGLGVVNFIPPYLVETGSMQTASDSRYVSVAGDDNLPEMAVGRLPVRDVKTLRRIIDRIIRYETEPAPEGMNSRIAFVADNPDSAGDFEDGIESLIENRIPPGMIPAKIYLSQLGLQGTRQEIIRQFEIGNLIIHYQGHGTINLWASENIFNAGDASFLDNAPKLPFIESMTCLNGYFFNPFTVSLAEELLRSEAGGAIAVWASTGYGIDQIMVYLSDGFLKEIYTENNRQLGAAINRAKLNLLRYGPFYDEIDTFTLFGDPALQLK